MQIQSCMVLNIKVKYLNAIANTANPSNTIANNTYIIQYVAIYLYMKYIITVCTNKELYWGSIYLYHSYNFW